LVKFDRVHKRVLRAENIVKAVQKVVQDVIAPELRELKLELASFRREMGQHFDSLEKQMNQRFGSVEQRFDSIHAGFDSLEKQSETQHRALLAEIRESRTHGGVVWQEIANLRERVAVLEAAWARKSSTMTLDRQPVQDFAPGYPPLPAHRIRS
jgi:chromosome segregation ATPase